MVESNYFSFWFVEKFRSMEHRKGQNRTQQNDVCAHQQPDSHQRAVCIDAERAELSAGRSEKDRANRPQT